MQVCVRTTRMTSNQDSGVARLKVPFEARLSSLDTAMPHAAVRAAHSASGHGLGADTFDSHVPNSAPPNITANAIQEIVRGFMISSIQRGSFMAHGGSPILLSKTRTTKYSPV